MILVERLRTAWQLLRCATGDDAYERYLEHHRRTHPDRPPLSRREFFIEEQRRKWSGVNRCC
ncbi:MAG: YbdD/YjiX family protein [Pseudomonadota bacterium]|jgi:Uncharacterized small protein|nr:MAG: DUF466 domain-containing protein [Pseudomonadota bacterium]